MYFLDGYNKDGDHSRVYLFNGYSDGHYCMVTKTAKVFSSEPDSRLHGPVLKLLVDLTTSALQWLQPWELLHSKRQRECFHLSVPHVYIVSCRAHGVLEQCAARTQFLYWNSAV